MLSSVAFHNFLSTHNALRAGEAEDDNILVQLVKLDEPSSKINLSVYPFNNVEVLYVFYVSVTVNWLCNYR
jgi:hypothetical protein